MYSNEKNLVESFAQFIAAKRASKEMTLEQFAEIVPGKFSAKHLSSIINGKKSPSVKTAGNILSGTRCGIQLEKNHIQGDTLMETFAKSFKAMRLSSGLTMAELSEKVYGTPRSDRFISDIENGKKSITLQTAGYFLDAFKCGWRWTEY